MTTKKKLEVTRELLWGAKHTICMLWEDDDWISDDGIRAMFLDLNDMTIALTNRIGK